MTNETLILLKQFALAAFIAAAFLLIMVVAYFYQKRSIIKAFAVSSKIAIIAFLINLFNNDNDEKT